MRKSIGWIALAGAVLLASPAWAGSIFVSGHDPVWHAHQGGNAAGANDLATIGIEYARDGSVLPFLFVESTDVAVPSGHLREAPFLTSNLGYGAGDFTVVNGADLAGLSDFRTYLDGFSAVVVASDFGGMLTAAELGFLNDHTDDLIDYLNGGGGLAAFAESNVGGLTTGADPFGFLPFLVASTAFSEVESGNTVTAFGASLGLVDADVNGNASHNYFTDTGGMTPVDLRNGDPNQILSLAWRGTINTGGVVSEVPEPGTLLLLGSGLAGLARWRRRKSG